MKLLSLGSLSSCGSSGFLCSLLGGSGLLGLSLLDGLVLFLLLGGSDGDDGIAGADLGAELAADALVIVHNSNTVDDMDSVLLALLLAQTAADTRDRADVHGSLALLQVGAGHVDLLGVGGNGNDQFAGASLHAGAAVGALLGINDGSTVFADGDGAELAGGDAGAEAQAAELTGQRAVAANLGSSHTVMEAFIDSLHLGAHDVAFLVHTLIAGAANQSHLAGHFAHLDTHDLAHSLGALIAAGSTQADFSLTL